MKDQPRFQLPFQQAFENFMINPQTNWERFFNPQFFISLNSADANVENNVLRQVGSYGKQLGKILDVLELVVARLPDNLTPREQLVVAQFQDFAQRVDAAVADYRGSREEGLSLSDIDRLIDGLQSLARSNPVAHRTFVERLQNALAAEGASGKAGSQPR
jgi:hypothetical protein